MPIKPENKALYPDNWAEISHSIRVDRAKNRCENCGIKNHAVIRRDNDGSIIYPCQTDWDMIHSRIRNAHSNMTESLKYHSFIKIILTVAHLDHNPQNNDPVNLKALCQKCHNNYDQKHRSETRKASKLKHQLTIFQ